MNGHSTEDDSNNTFFPGDILWAKVGSHPYWPCMVTYNPEDGNYCKKKPIRCKVRRIYHVQYFGPVKQHGWTTPGNFFPFKGKTEFIDKKRKLEEQKKTLGYGGSKALTKLIAKFCVQPLSKDRWICAVEDAEKALKCRDKKARFRKYVINFGQKKGKENFGQRKIKEGTKKKDLAQKAVFTNAGTSSQEDKNANISVQQAGTSMAKRIKLSGNSSDQICNTCEKKNIDFSCSGSCSKSFHMKCLDVESIPQDFKCSECRSGIFPCFICQKSHGAIIKCAHSKCSKYYHTDCINEFGCVNKDRKICPQHTCLTCYRKNPRGLCNKGTMVKCNRCPIAFHSEECCIAAGSVELSTSIIVCPFHFVGKQRISHQLPCNVNYCIICNKDGRLVCCEACPNAFHESCLKTTISSEEFICEDCENRKYLLFGMIVWVKCGNFRWWPAKIINPSDLPENVKVAAHFNGEFPVKFYGTYNFSWTHSGRVIPYNHDHKTYKAPKVPRLKEQYKRSLEEAAQAFDEYKAYQSSENLLDDKPGFYKHIRVNRALPPAQFVTKATESVDRCNCDISSENPCGPDSGCLNGTMLLECQPDVCNAENCQNQRFQRRQYATTKLFKTVGRGWGLLADQDIKKGQFVIEYVGEVITHEEYRKRSGEMKEREDINYYFLYLDSKRMLDAGPMGNSSRFINHSCQPNCEMVKWSVSGDDHIGIFALKDIRPGEELTFDYHSDKCTFSQECLCAAPNCRGFIGKKSAASSKAVASTSKPSTSKIPPTEVLLTNDLNIKDFSIKVDDDQPKVIQIEDLNLNMISIQINKKLPFVNLNDVHPTSSVEPKRSATAVSSIPVKKTSSQNHCFICKRPGTLLICDKKGCVRAYHLSCIGLKVVPPGVWICASHQCNICGKVAAIICCLCPTSFCAHCWKFKPLPSPFMCQICEVKSRSLT